MSLPSHLSLILLLPTPLFLSPSLPCSPHLSSPPPAPLPLLPSPPHPHLLTTSPLSPPLPCSPHLLTLTSPPPSTPSQNSTNTTDGWATLPQLKTGQHHTSSCWSFIHLQIQFCGCQIYLCGSLFFPSPDLSRPLSRLLSPTRLSLLPPTYLFSHPPISSPTHLSLLSPTYLFSHPPTSSPTHLSLLPPSDTYCHC